MDIIIQSLGFKAGEKLEAFIGEKLEKLNPKDHIVRAQVTLYLGPDKATPNTYCEIRLEVPGNDHFVKESAPQFEQAIDQTVDKLQAMLRKTKEKMTEHRPGRG